MLIDGELYLEEIDKNGEKQEKRVRQITSIGINYPALAFTIKGGEQIYFIDQYKFASIDCGLISSFNSSNEIKKLSADDFEATNENEFMNSLTLNLRRDKYIEKHKGVFLEYENISFDFHDRIRSQLKFLKIKFDDEYTVNRKYDGRILNTLKPIIVQNLNLQFIFKKLHQLRCHFVFVLDKYKYNH